MARTAVARIISSKSAAEMRTARTFGRHRRIRRNFLYLFSRRNARRTACGRSRRQTRFRRSSRWRWISSLRCKKNSPSIRIDGEFFLHRSEDIQRHLELRRNLVCLRLRPQAVLRALRRENKYRKLRLIRRCRPNVRAVLISAADLLEIIRATAVRAMQPENQRVFLTGVVVRRHEEAVRHLVARFVRVHLFAESEVVLFQNLRRGLSEAAGARTDREQHREQHGGAKNGHHSSPLGSDESSFRDRAAREIIRPPATAAANNAGCSPAREFRDSLVDPEPAPGRSTSWGARRSMRAKRSLRRCRPRSRCALWRKLRRAARRGPWCPSTPARAADARWPSGRG